MPSRAIAVLAVAAAGVLAGSAALAAVPSPGTVQVTGTQLRSALLPVSAFGPDYANFRELDSGHRLQRAGHPGAVSCSLFSVLLGDSMLPGSPVFGETASATEEDLGAVVNPVRSYIQAVYQFASSRTAASLYAQAYARYAKCRSFTFSGVHITLKSESKTQAGGHQAFQVTQAVSIPGTDPAVNNDADTLLSIDGADIFIVEVGAPPASMPAPGTVTAFAQRLIARVQALH